MLEHDLFPLLCVVSHGGSTSWGHELKLSRGSSRAHFLLFFKKTLFIFGPTGSLLLGAGFLQLQQVGATLPCLCILNVVASLVAEYGLLQSWHTGVVAP